MVFLLFFVSILFYNQSPSSECYTAVHALSRPEAVPTERDGQCAVVMETVAAVPVMVGATINHRACLRRMCDDRGWIKTLMDEAENERMHLMTFIEISKPTWYERAVIIGVQWVFYLFFFALYLVSSKTAHRVVGYFEEERSEEHTSELQSLMRI